MIFACMELFLVIFLGFPWFPECVGTLSVEHKNTLHYHDYKG